MIALNRKKLLPIGLHLQPQMATLIQLEASSQGYAVREFASAEMPWDADMSSELRDHEIAATLKKVITTHRFKGKSVVSCLGAEELFVQNVRLPHLQDEEVAKVIQWEAEERLPYPSRDAEIRHVRAGQVRQDSDLKQEIILLACHQGVVERHIHLLELAGLVPEAIDVDSCAMLRSLCPPEWEDAPGRRRAYVHLGERATAVVFAEGTQILFLKFLATGSYHLDMAIARELDLTLIEAGRLRGRVTAADVLNSDDEIHCSVINAIRGTLESLAEELELCMRYYKVTFRGKPLEKVVVTGNDANPWFLDFLSDLLRTPCEVGNPFEQLTELAPAPADLKRPWCWSTAVGLSLKGAT